MSWLKNNRLLWPLLKPGYPDGARLMAQRHVLQDLAGEDGLRGCCLNAGCGEGLYLPFLDSFRAISRIENIDISIPEEIAARHPDPRHRFQVASLTDLPFPDAQFDSCLCTEVIEHILDHGKAASELARVLKPGGILIASVPQTPAPWDPNHARQGYSVAEFTGLLHAAGLDVVAHRSCFHISMRLIMRYWRRPWIRFGASRTPYLPESVLTMMARLDRVLRIGKPWDLAVRAAKSQ
jgi:SAM-dependent methyltransferase